MYTLNATIDWIVDWWLGFSYEDYSGMAVIACVSIYYRFLKAKMMKRYKYQYDAIGHKNYNLEQTLKWAEKTYITDYKPQDIYAFYAGKTYIKKHIVRKYKGKVKKLWTEWQIASV